MQQSLVKEIIDLMTIYDRLQDWDMTKEAEHILTLISSLTLGLKYNLQQPQ